MNEEKLLSPGRERLAQQIIQRVGEPVDISDPEKMTEDEAVLVMRFLMDIDQQRALFIVSMARGEISGDVILEGEE